MQLPRIALAMAAAFSVLVLTQRIATQAPLKTVQVACVRAPQPPGQPNHSASKTVEQLHAQAVRDSGNSTANPMGSMQTPTGHKSLEVSACILCDRQGLNELATGSGAPGAHGFKPQAMTAH